MAQAKVPRRDAVRLLETDRRAVLKLYERLSSRARSTPGLDGGEWSPCDLLGHLESWEEHALRAIDAWSRNEPAPVDRELRARGVNAVNADEVRRKAGRTPGGAAANAAATHGRLVEALRAIADDRWNAPATTRTPKPLGDHLGRILGGPAGPFRHDAAHLPSLRAFVEAHTR